ncbi:hypothetical protein [Burkholderia pseudomallei]|uniref:hypothetical protein n=1 Tax=Burkholderia pseudomallei TaxID=28450 RepID=UPI001AD6BE33|nr:hypothetical protein [Burkholderia pseudomallei]MBO7843169.1 hypothetical protein [Burkholderia pseudomallei]
MRERVCRDDLTRQRDRAALLRRVAVARRGAARAEAGQRRRLTLEPGRKSESESESKSKSKPKSKPKPKSKSKPQAASRKPQAASETETETETEAEAEAEACANRTLGARA